MSPLEIERKKKEKLILMDSNLPTMKISYLSKTEK